MLPTENASLTSKIEPSCRPLVNCQSGRSSFGTLPSRPTMCFTERRAGDRATIVSQYYMAPAEGAQHWPQKLGNRSGPASMGSATQSFSLHLGQHVAHQARWASTRATPRSQRASWIRGFQKDHPALTPAQGLKPCSYNRLQPTGKRNAASYLLHRQGCWGSGLEPLYLDCLLSSQKGHLAPRQAH